MGIRARRSFAYCRLHGSEQLYASGYDDAALESWADRIAAWASGREHTSGTRVVDKPMRERASRDVFVYFDNGKKVRAPWDAHSLIDKVVRRLKT